MPLYPTNPLRLTNAAIRFTGTELPPATVADFLPPVLQKLTIFIPRSPSQAESDAAIRVTTATVVHYGSQNTDVTVAALDGDSMLPPAPPQQFERQVVIREGPGDLVSLQSDTPVPSLAISGSAGEFTNQARLLSSDLSRLALSTRAAAGPLKSSPELPTNLTAIRDLGQPGVNATAVMFRA